MIFQDLTLRELTVNFDSQRRPVKSSDRKPGIFPYFGASGVVDHVDDFLFDGEYLLIAEDGENLRSRSTPIAFLADGRFWVNNHAHVVKASDEADLRFLKYKLSITDVSGYLTGSAQPKLSRSSMDSILLRVPGITDQIAIAEVLGTLDDKIAANRKLIQTASDLAEAFTRESVEAGRTSELNQIADVVMGSSPAGASLNEGGRGTVFYQGVRDFGFRFPKRRIWTEQVTRVAEAGDTLLSVRAPVGRVNLASEPICIGRGLAAIRTTVGAPATLFNLLKAFPEVWEPFEAEGTIFGSINRGQLEGLQVPSVKPELAAGLESRLAGLEASITSALAENNLLAELRDTLIPELMSGRLRVKAAEKKIEEVV